MDLRKIIREELNQKSIEWVKPRFDDEVEEFELFLSEITNLPSYINPYSTPQKPWGEIITNLEKIYNKSNIEVLSDDEWSQMENTDSWQLETEEDIYNIVGGYGRSKERILKHSLEPIKNGGIVETPIVAYVEGNPPYLVAGNTRLSACKVLGVTPMVTKVYL
jgi:hypothetical protein